ncbi:cysteine hydrolase [Roseomonas sp. GC11]|uniref:isochorismatase family protein n=1 Tax=Roseomonas sp. GC11 TaxID=2950546 RepID=UPI0021094A6A|nr:cysteine hydrolase [Roseomonas sp. GC11]MCQ4159357.1 cysteine hydrolase [Roseomonas sp. GC11]
MHTIAIPDSVVQRVIAKRGTAHPYADLDPARTALIVIDMQNGYLREDVAHAFVPGGTDIVPNINRLAAALRRRGGSVWWVQNASDEASRAAWSVLEDSVSPAQRAARIRSMTPGSVGHALWEGLDIHPEDPVVAKYRYSAFIQGASELEAQLRARGIDTLLITGTLTNVCCESSARDAMMLNFRVVMVSDGNAAVTDAEHNASLINLYLTFADVMTTAELEACLDRAAPRAAA